MLLDKLVGAAVGSCNGSGSVSCGAFVNSATYSQFFIVRRSLRHLHQYLLHRERPCAAVHANRDRRSALLHQRGHEAEFLRRRERPLGRLRAPVLVPLADLHPRTRPMDELPFSGTFLNLPPAMISWYQDRAFLLPAEVLFQDRDRPVLKLPSASYCR
jgi:hypothetical protein